MRHGFVKVAAATPDIRVADVEYNTEQICRAIDQAYEKGAKIVAFPELCVTGYTCGDLFTQNVLLNAAYGAVKKIAGHTKGKNILAFVGMPLTEGGKLYNGGGSQRWKSDRIYNENISSQLRRVLRDASIHSGTGQCEVDSV